MSQLQNHVYDKFNELKEIYIVGDISDLKTYGNSTVPSEHIVYFDITGDMTDVTTNGYECYRIFQYEDTINYINIDKISDIIDHNRYEDNQVVINEIVANTEMSVNIMDTEDCFFMVDSVIKSMYNHAHINENCKIRRHTKIQTDQDVTQSLAAHDAKYGTKEENDFKQELEDKQKKDGTIGALDPAQEESVKPKLPNVNLITEKKLEIVYEVNDEVIYKNQKWHVYAIDEFDYDKQRLHITWNGQTESVLATDVEPDPVMLKALEENPYNDEENLQGMITRKDIKDLNQGTIKCNLVVDGYALNSTPLLVNISDIVESNDVLNVINDAGETSPCNINELSFEQENWPWGVIVDTEGEPERKIQVNPISYINAQDDDMVEILIAGKESKLPKRSFKIILN